MSGNLILGLATFLVASITPFGIAYLFSTRFFGGQGTRIRICSTMIFGFWFQGIIFYGLLYTGHFTRLAAGLIVLCLIVSSAFFARRYGADLESYLRRDLDAVTAVVKLGLRHRLKWLTAITALLLTGHLIRALHAPPMAWDDLTYHLPRAALWTQTGEFSSYGAPGAWEYYLYFLPLGDALAAWGLLFTHTDMVIPIIGLAVWVLLVVAIYSLAREFAIAPKRAYIVALGAGLIPAIAAHLFTAYVDNFVALLQVSALALLVAMARRDSIPCGAVAIVGLASAVAIKESAAVLFVCGVLLFLVVAIWKNQHHKFSGFSLAIAGTIAIIAPPVIFTWIQTGSPTYPFALEIADTLIFPGNAEWQTHRASEQNMRTTAQYIVGTVWGGYLDNPVIHTNFGVSTLLIILANLVGLKSLLWESNHRTLNTIVLLLAVVLFGALFATNAASGINRARYFVAAGVIVAVLIATIPRDWAGWVIIGAWAINCLYFLPTNWSILDATIVAIAIVLLLPFTLIGFLILKYWRGLPQRSRLVPLVLLPSLVTLFLATCVAPMRDIFRYDLYERAAQGSSYLNHPVTGGAALGMHAWPIWEALDEPDHQYRIAVTAGWDGRGHNWFVYPYFGHQLQNDIVYIPVTESGQIVSLRDPELLLDHANYQAWVQRLRDNQIDYIATLAPHTLERLWMANNPSDFEYILTGDVTGNDLFALRDATADDGDP